MPEKQIINEETVRSVPLKPVKRLCNEIQLFDLCNQEQCRYKEGRLCTNEEMLNRFEQIAEVDFCKPVYVADEIDEDSDNESDDYDAFTEDRFDEEDRREIE